MDDRFIQSFILNNESLFFYVHISCVWHANVTSPPSPFQFSILCTPPFPQFHKPSHKAFHASPSPTYLNPKLQPLIPIETLRFNPKLHPLIPINFHNFNSNLPAKIYGTKTQTTAPKYSHPIKFYGIPHQLSTTSMESPLNFNLHHPPPPLKKQRERWCSAWHLPEISSSVS